MSAAFVHCPGCGRYMLGQRINGATYPQPHQCDGSEEDS